MWVSPCSRHRWHGCAQSTAGYVQGVSAVCHSSSAGNGQHGTIDAPSAAPALGACASSERAWWLWAGRYSQGRRAGPLGAQPLPQGCELSASKVADSPLRQTLQERPVPQAHRHRLRAARRPPARGTNGGPATDEDRHQSPRALKCESVGSFVLLAEDIHIYTYVFAVLAGVARLSKPRARVRRRDCFEVTQCYVSCVLQVPVRR